MARLFLFLFLALSVGATAVSRESFFGTARYEEGDHAANALRIRRAAKLRELHGNYSRWNFHHPGPAFFQVAALGEWVLHKATRVAPAPHNAHLHTSALLQLAFYAAALALVARRARQPWVVVALGLGAAALHLPHIDRVLYSVWPPDVLLMPFLCFVVACAAVAVGDRAALPLLVLSGGFLVHGHVAQPLFVLPMSVAAVGVACLRPWAGRVRSIASSGPGIAAGVLLVLFLLPLAIDLFDGRRSNAHDVLLHLKFQRDAGQTLWQSFLCYLSYYAGMNDPSVFNQLNEAAYAVLRERWPLLAGWAVVLACVVWWLFLRRQPAKQPTALSFGRALVLSWLAAGALTLAWGMRQDGGFNDFNSQFNHALAHVLALLGVVVIAEWLGRVPRAAAIPSVLAGVIAVVLAVPYELEVGTLGDEMEVRLAALLQADPHPTAPKLLQFEPDDWYEPVTLASALQRRGIDSYVDSRFRILFGRDRVFANQGNVLDGGSVSVWHIMHRKAAPEGAHVVDRDYRVVFRTPPATSFPVAATFADAGPPPLQLCGVGGTEGDWAWTNGHLAAFRVRAPAADRALRLTLDASGMVSGLRPRGQRVLVRVNGAIIGSAVFNDERKAVRLPVSRDVWNRRATQTIVLELPDAHAPSDTGASGDRRVLGLRLYGVTVEPAERDT